MDYPRRAGKRRFFSGKYFLELEVTSVTATPAFWEYKSKSESERGFVNSNHDILAALKAELEFLDNNGYGRPFRSNWRPTLLFRDSPICSGFTDSSSERGCCDCFLMQWAAIDGKTELIPCHHIPLNSAGETIASLQRTGSQAELDRVYREWLSARIQEIEKREELYMQTLQTAAPITFKNILFLTDFSHASEAAKKYAIALAKHHDAQLFPAHAFNPIVLSENSIPQLIDEAEGELRTSLNRLVSSAGTKGKGLLSNGLVEDALPVWIRENNIDLVVTGTHGRKGIDRFLLGSTAELVFRAASCPVLTVGPNVVFDEKNPFTPTNILVPTNFGIGTEAAVECALSLASETKAKLTFMHVVSLEQSFQNDRATLVREAQDRLEKLIPADAEAWIKPKIIVEVGEPKAEMLGYISELKPDLVILGLPASQHFSTHLQAGVSYSIVSSAHCPVLTVRHSPEP